MMQHFCIRITTLSVSPANVIPKNYHVEFLKIKHLY